MAVLDLATIKTNVASVMAGVAGILGASPSDLDSIPTTPWVTVGDPKSTGMAPGNWERIDFDLPILIYVDQTMDAARTDALVLPLVAATITAFKPMTAIQLGGTVVAAFINSWDAGVYVKLGTPPTEVRFYRCIEFQLRVTVAGAGGYGG